MPTKRIRKKVQKPVEIQTTVNPWKSEVKSENQPKKSVFQYLVHQWQFWLIVAVLVLVIIFATINFSENDTSPYQAPVRVVQPASSTVGEAASDARANISDALAVQDSSLAFISKAVSAMPIITGIIIGIFILSIFFRVRRRF
jgi:hypothetical protein